MPQDVIQLNVYAHDTLLTSVKRTCFKKGSQPGRVFFEDKSFRIRSGPGGYFIDVSRIYEKCGLCDHVVPSREFDHHMRAVHHAEKTDDGYVLSRVRSHDPSTVREARDLDTTSRERDHSLKTVSGGAGHGTGKRR